MRYLREKFRSLDIEIDGGVGPANIAACAEVRNTFCIKCEIQKVCVKYRAQTISSKCVVLATEHRTNWQNIVLLFLYCYRLEEDYVEDDLNIVTVNVLLVL